MGGIGKANKSFLSLVEECDKSVRTLKHVLNCSDNDTSFPYGPAADSYYQLYLPGDEQPHGYILPAVVAKMPWTARFNVQHEHPRTVTIKDTSGGTDTATSINAAFEELITICIDQDLFHVLCARHSEPFAIAGARYEKPVSLERFATNLFGITTRGAHLIAYTNTAEGMMIWVPRRSSHLYTYPDMLDTTVAGGVKSGVPPFETIVEEADEEASLPEDLIRRSTRSRGVISHMSLTGRGFPGEQGLVVPDYIYVYDIELPVDVVPKPHDDEVDSFTCMTVAQVEIALLEEKFKPDSAAVMIDYLIRHSIISADNEPNFVEINMRLHRRLPFRTG